MSDNATFARVLFEDVPRAGEGTEPLAFCSACHRDVEREECESCAGDGVRGHDCGEDSCSCADPQENVPCSDCDGAGAHWKCPTCGYINPPREHP